MIDKWEVWRDYDTPPSWYTDEEKKLHELTADKVLAEYSRDQLEQSWRWVLKELASLEIGSIPELNFEDIKKGDVSPEHVTKAKQAGCFVVRGVVDESESRALNDSLQKYLSAHSDTVSGWPAATPHIKQLYWTEAQVKLRANPNHLFLQEWLNKLWEQSSTKPQQNVSSSEPTHSTPLTYVDALRSVPGKESYVALGPHIDAGSLSRWLDDDYRHFYHDVFSGHPERLDLYRLKERSVCKQHLIPGPAHSSVLRTFQGWTCLTDVGPNKGGIWFYPRINLTVTYLLLRPFFKEVKSEEEITREHAESSESSHTSSSASDRLPTPDTAPVTPENGVHEEASSRGSKACSSSDSARALYLSSDNWEFCRPSYFPGTQSTMSQCLGNKTHPHLELTKRLVSIPDLTAGDSVWWHCDGIHAVEPNHLYGDDPAVVVYIASVPTTKSNIDYVKAQAETYRARKCPPDFYQSHDEVHEWDSNWMKGGEKAMMMDQ
ncbi:hypothetical protein CJU90_5127 [Yarrowia sp. C11]|nr:hypothetical protein CJU90_5127 [Yarrowia sp. C11]KAG5364927.1 hypothetical protein CKK34_3755 [Yarrowia sp. E02]